MSNEFLNQCIELFNTINPDIVPYVAIVSIVFFLTRGKNKWLLKIDLAHCQVNGLEIRDLKSLLQQLDKANL